MRISTNATPKLNSTREISPATAAAHRVVILAAAFKLIYRDPGVDGILLNIFGGMMRCNDIAEGLVAAAREVGLSKPLVVRLEGTNVERGREILRESGLPIEPVESMGDAAKKIVAAVKEVA